ncbi:helix-turn-helix domain-containing protein [Thalassolituus sp.]|uniref:helix-turn-helix domain-containing protein n=1 Tax=Thalassolituus sp. TaxID=2030822 RepID=UPI003519AB87
MKKVPSALVENLASNVKSIRLARGVSQEELADMCGLHRTYIGSVERGERNVTLSTLEALAIALGVDAGKLLVKGAFNVQVRQATAK